MNKKPVLKLCMSALSSALKQVLILIYPMILKKKFKICMEKQLNTKTICFNRKKRNTKKKYKIN